MDMTHRDFTAISAEDEEEERRSFLKVYTAFKQYKICSINRVNKTEQYMNTLPKSHQDMLLRYRNHLNKVRDCIHENFKIILKMIKNVDHIFCEPSKMTTQEDKYKPKFRSEDLERVKITMRQFVRDWSAEGEEERKQCYKPIIDEIMDFYNPQEVDVGDLKILVPGAGLGRLAYELAYRGYACEGNEYSMFMLIASNFVINRCETENQHVLYPWVHQYVNNVCRNNQIAAVCFPDISPIECPPKGAFTMVAGDFLQVYKEPDSWDGVATCFFIDCANNVIEFVERIFRILKPGGVWVNLGPLLYHYSDVLDEFSIEPTFEDLTEIIRTVGFEILKCQTGLRTQYAQNPHSMAHSKYLSVFFVCRKPFVEYNHEAEIAGNGGSPQVVDMNFEDGDDYNQVTDEN